MSAKKFIPCIYLYEKQAVKSKEDHEIVSLHPVELAVNYCELGCDGILIVDLSASDKEHEENLDVIKEICQNAVVPVLGTGNIHRMEDVKKLLYAGCKQAVLDYTREDNVAITEEVSLKFGKEKILASLDCPEAIFNRKEKLAQFVSEIILTNGAALKESALLSPVPVLTFMPEISLEKLLETLKLDNVSGITGQLVNANMSQLEALKGICKDNGILVLENNGAISFEELKKGSDGLVPVIVQDAKSNQVLMMAYMNKEAYEDTLKTGRMHYYSRSRQSQWLKGETSGHYQYVHSISADCDLDTLLAKVTQVGAACHTGSYSCFFNEVQTRVKEERENHNPMKVFDEVYQLILDRKEHPKEGSYTNYLFDKGIDKILKKLGEEATEIVIAAKNPNANEVKYEISDFLYHMMVLMAEKNVTWEEITTELANR